MQARGIDPNYRDYRGHPPATTRCGANSSRRCHASAGCCSCRSACRVEDKCPAPFDEFGLLCKQCGLCTIQELQEEAERLGYAVLVAEGSALVMSLIQTGKIDAMVGVSCISVLERASPTWRRRPIPGIAIPLLQDDCKDTTVDLEWIWDVIHLTSDDSTRRLDLDGLRKQVDTWFTPGALRDVLGPEEGGQAVRTDRA